MRTVVLVSDSTDLSRSLMIMMNLSTNFKILDIADDQELGLMMVKENRPEMLFIKLTLRWAILSNFIENVKSESPETKCIVIVDRFDDYFKAAKSGADEVLQKGFTIAMLNQLLYRLYSSQTIVGLDA